jgi:hypothetical protein
MLTATKTSWVARISGVAIVMALTPTAALAQQNSAMPRPLVEFLASLPRLPVGPEVRKALNDAIGPLSAERYDEARAAIGKLNPAEFTPFERSNTEHILFRSARAEGKFGEARQHILNALDSGGLNEQEIAHAHERLEEIDAALTTAPPT